VRARVDICQRFALTLRWSRFCFFITGASLSVPPLSKRFAIELSLAFLDVNGPSPSLGQKAAGAHFPRASLSCGRTCPSGFSPLLFSYRRVYFPADSSRRLGRAKPAVDAWILVFSAMKNILSHTPSNWFIAPPFRYFLPPPCRARWGKIHTEPSSPTFSPYYWQDLLTPDLMADFPLHPWRTWPFLNLALSPRFYGNRDGILPVAPCLGVFGIRCVSLPTIMRVISSCFLFLGTPPGKTKPPHLDR